MSSFLTQLDTLEGHHGPQTPCWPVDPYEFLIWWHCGYPASDATCTKGWASLQEHVGVRPEQLLKAKPATLTMALKAGGLIPELRTERVRLIANAAVREFNGNLARAFLPSAQGATGHCGSRRRPNHAFRKHLRHSRGSLECNAGRGPHAVWPAVGLLHQRLSCRSKAHRNGSVSSLRGTTTRVSVTQGTWAVSLQAVDSE
jgi:hypothetical protein